MYWLRAHSVATSIPMYDFEYFRIQTLGIDVFSFFIWKICYDQNIFYKNFWIEKLFLNYYRIYNQNEVFGINCSKRSV